MIHEVCSVDAGKKLVRTHGGRIISATVMIPLIPGDTPRALFPLVSSTNAAAGIRHGQEDSERISILQEGDKYEADTTAP
jgi:hypothetical protein